MAVSTLRRLGGNLPVELTSFIGRRREIAEVKRLLAVARLVTLTGIGGIGKTRLAVRVAAETRRVFADGVWLVELAALGDPALVPATVGRALGLRDESKGAVTRLLSSWLADRHLLLVLDNCEQVVDACAVLLDELLRVASDLRVLATSRQPLGVAGEQEYRVPALALPALDEPVPGPRLLMQSEAVSLFTERARAVAPGFVVTEDNHRAVLQLAHRLDGIPLALELAAARLKVLSPEQIVGRLDDRFGLLRSGNRGAAPRQRSLQALVDWSFALCSAGERTLWARLSVFPRDFDVDAAEEICSDERIPRAAVLDLLAGLVDKSVLSTDGAGPRVRYWLPETLHAYGRARLAASGEEMSLRRRHRGYYRRLAVQSMKEWFGPDQLHWVSRLHAEHLNVRTALENCLAEPDGVSEALAMVPALHTYWFVTGSVGEGRRFIAKLLDAHREPSAGRADALAVASWLAANQGDVDAAEATSAQAQRLARQYGSVQRFVRATLTCAMAAMLRGDRDRAAELFQDVLDQSRAIGDDLGAVSSADRLAQLAWLSGDVDKAVALLREALAISERHGESWRKAETLLSLGIARWQQGHVEDAGEHIRASLAIQARFHNHVGIAQCLEALAWIAATISDHERAACLLGAAHATWHGVVASLFPHLAEFHDRCLAQARAALGDRLFRATHRRGDELPLVDAVHYALSTKAPPASTNTDEKDALTRREREIAGLVAEGLSNRQIAAKLMISQRTAEGHVEHILTKLGFTSRAQIASWDAAHRP
ncbi:MAG TPA: LuxR C-terminal-related transcriptional regulator [Kribbellaceae bacterium]|jgi:non-specific serine/threonine protein kinase